MKPRCSPGGCFNRALTPTPEIGRYELREQLASPSVSGRTSIQELAPVAVVEDGSGVAQALARELAAAGCASLVVNSPELPSRVRSLVFLGLVPDSVSASDCNREAFRYAKAMASRLSAQGGAFFTVQDTGGDFGLSGRVAERAWSAGLSALAKTAAQEWPLATVRALDLECAVQSVASLARRLAAEILAGGSELEVGLRANGRRTTPVSVAASAPAQALSSLAPGSVVVASGGARGVTATTLIALARTAQPRIALLGRTPLVEDPAWAYGITGEGELKTAMIAQARAAATPVKPKELQAAVSAIVNAREVADTLRMLAEAGSEAMYFAADIADPAGVDRALAAVRQQWGPIHGLVHGAGVLADKRIEEKTLEQFDRVFSVKVDGLKNLLRATSNDPLRIICLFSSIAARVGNVGQVDYAMGNEVLNKVANAEAQRRGGSCTVKSLNWGPWEGGMVTPALKEHFQRRNVPLIPLAAGARSFVEEILSAPGGAVEIVLGGDPAYGLGSHSRASATA